MPKEYSKGRAKNRNPDGSWTGRGDPSEGLTRKFDKTPEELRDEREGAIESGKGYAEKFGEYSEKLEKWSDKKKAFNQKYGSALVPKGTKLPNFRDKKPTPLSIAGDVAWWILNPPLDPDSNAPDWEMPPYPDNPLDPPYPKNPSICGMGPIRMEGIVWREGMPTYMDEYRVFMTDARDPGMYYWPDLPTVGTFVQPNTKGNPNYQPKRTGGVYGQRKSKLETEFFPTFTRMYKDYAFWSQATGEWPGANQKFISNIKTTKTIPGHDEGGYGTLSSQNGSPYYDPSEPPYFGHFIPWAEKVCSIEIIYDENIPDTINPNDYDREVDDGMGCQWQKDEVSYDLPELKIGDSKIGGSSIKIDDGLIPLANFLVKSIEMMHKGIGLDKLDTEFPVSVMKQDGTKVKPKSIAELSQWQFDNVSSLVGLPVVNTITSLDDKTKDLTFKNIQDCLSYLVHQQRESDNDLMVIEGYATRIAQQLEAVTQIALRQQADIEMLIKEGGFRWKWKTVSRPGLYKIGMKDDDEKTGILELFKGGTVSYPIRIWDDKVDARQIAMTTNLYSELASKSNYHSYNSNQGIPGLDARTKMNKDSEEIWKEWVETVNKPEKGVVSGNPTPFIEEYTTGNLAAKAVPKPASGLSLFMKPKAPATGFKSKKPA
jgi:hypothetical protein